MKQTGFLDNPNFVIKISVANDYANGHVIHPDLYNWDNLINDHKHNHTLLNEIKAQSHKFCD